MRALAILSICLLALAFATSPAAATAEKCVKSVSGHTVCVAPDEPSYVECVYLDGGEVACIVDPCGTTMCW